FVFAISPNFNYQVKLTDGSGAPLTGTHTIFFSLFQGGTSETAESGSVLYRENAAIGLVDGIADHTVGTGTPMDDTTLTVSQFTFDFDLFLQVAVDTAGNVILPRAQINMVPFAMRALNADQADNGILSSTLVMTESTTPPAGLTYTGMTDS